MRYRPYVIEVKWQKRWLQKKTYEPDLKRAKRPFYNLMMFPYPSAEGLHVGNMYAFVGADIYGRLKRMQRYDVFEPIGLDGFGIHSENYALSIERHPAKQAKISEKNFYRQFGMIGNGFAWREHLETYDPEYYKWTQWIFVQMFKRGLAYRKKATVNWCPSCLTVLADEQVLAGECERCGTRVVKKELEQWFFKITDYAERLLHNLERIDWSEKIKIAQRNWIGRSEGAEIHFPLVMKYHYVLLHGFKGSSKRNFFPWVTRELEKRGLRVFVPDLPNAANPREDEQVSYVLEHAKFDANTILLGHSLGSAVALKVLERLSTKIAGLVLVGGFLRPDFVDHPRPFAETFKWTFDFEKIKRNVGFVNILSDRNDYAVPLAEGRLLQKHLGGELIETTGRTPHFTAEVEPEVLENLFPGIIVFTTRPDTLFGATYMVLAPEHPLIENYKLQITNYKEVAAYLQNAKAKTGEERIAEGHEKTGVELKGVKAMNSATNEEIPIWVADYVLGHVGTGAIMAVPAHDERDFEFAKKLNLPIREVISPDGKAHELASAYIGTGMLINSGRFNGMASEQAKWEITTFVGGARKVQYRLRDWLISRQRYWGPPIPMIFCAACAARAEQTRNHTNGRRRTDAEQTMAGWHPVPEKDLPVKLPYIKNFRPTGTEKSPLATIGKFYKVRCPTCRAWARRETDVSDTFLDSAWYYLRYPSTRSARSGQVPWDPRITKRWFPVDMYIGGAEHAVLHLLYVRFLAMAFYDWGLTHFEEPFKRFRAHGLLIKDGAKMSKSRGNVVNPDEYITAYGADALRMYLMFLGPFEQGGDFRDTGIRGITRFLERVWRFCNRPGAWAKQQDESMTRSVHKTVKKVTDDIEGLQYNTAISALMVLLNEFEAKSNEVTAADVKVFLKLLAPFAPYISEELWQLLQKKRGRWQSIHRAQWPRYNPELIREATFELVIQVNGKVRGRVTLPVGASEEEAKRVALGIERVRHYVTGEPKKVIFVPNTLINFVVG